MNPALTPLSQIRVMTNAELVNFAKEHSTLTILEREFVNRMTKIVDEEQLLQNFRMQFTPQDVGKTQTVKSIVDWAKQKMGDRP